MSKAIEDLKHEHEAILFTLKVMKRIIDLIDSGKPVGTADPIALVAFLKEFADKCHHGKEEGILFPALEKAGIMNEGGPIGVMLSDHILGRERIRNMDAALKGVGDLPVFAREAEAYSDLLTKHIDKENSVLFPMGEKVLSGTELDEIYERFERHEATVIGAGRHEELHAMLNKFEEKYLR